MAEAALSVLSAIMAGDGRAGAQREKITRPQLTLPNFAHLIKFLGLTLNPVVASRYKFTSGFRAWPRTDSFSSLRFETSLCRVDGDGHVKLRFYTAALCGNRSPLLQALPHPYDAGSY